MIKAGDKVVIDTDFLNKITQAPHIADGKELFLRTVKELDVVPVTHYYIAEREMTVSNPIAVELINEGHIQVCQKEDFIRDEAMAEEYGYFFRKWYNYLNPSDRLGREVDVFTLRRSRHSLGEIHALLMARYMSVPLIMSDDSDAKDLVNYAELSEIRVCDLVDVYIMIGQKAKKNITLKEVENIIRNECPKDSPRQKRKKRDKYRKVRDVWKQ